MIIKIGCNCNIVFHNFQSNRVKAIYFENFQIVRTYVFRSYFFTFDITIDTYKYM